MEFVKTCFSGESVKLT